MIELPNKKKCYNLPEQVAQNLLNIQYLAEQYKNIDELPSIWADYKTAFDADLHTFEDWTTTFEGWENTLSTYLANMSSAAVGAIAGQNIAPANVAATGNITAPSIIENMTGYTADLVDTDTKKTITNVYTGAVKTGNKLTLVSAVEISINDVTYNRYAYLCSFTIPAAVGSKLYPAFGSILDTKNLNIVVDGDVETQKEGLGYVQKGGGNQTLYFRCKLPADFEIGKTYYIRYEATFLLSDGLI